MDRSEIPRLVEMAARIIYFGLKNPEKISQNREFIELFREYEINSALQEYVESIAHGLDLELLRVERTGVFLYPHPKSIFSIRLSDIPALGKEKNREIFPIILLAIAAYFYPEMHHFDRPGYAGLGLDEETLDTYIREKIKMITEKMNPLDIDSDIEQPELEKLFIKYHKLKKSSGNPQSQSDSLYLIKKTFEYLQSQRLLIKDGKKYYPSQRFRYQMEELVTNEHFQQFIEKTQSESK